MDDRFGDQRFTCCRDRFSQRGGGAERVIVTLLRHLNRLDFRLGLAVVDMRGGGYRDDVPEDVEFIDLRCTRVRYALPKIMRLIWQRRPDVVFSTLGHLNLALAMLRPLLPNGVRYIGREACIVSETLSEIGIPACGLGPTGTFTRVLMSWYASLRICGTT